jgi:hypothetical protein
LDDQKQKTPVSRSLLHCIASCWIVDWWTRSQSIRTEGAIPFEVAIAAPSEVPTYIGIAEKALHLKELNMNPNQIAVALKVDRTTVLRALRWVKSIPVYTTESFREA